MPVQASYFLMVVIWSTTPLGIVWSSETVAPTLAVFLRMLVGLVLASFVVAVANIRVLASPCFIPLWLFKHRYFLAACY